MNALDLLGRVACTFGMASEGAPPRITAKVTIEGPAEEVLADVQALRAGRREVSLTVYVSRKFYSLADHFLPAIRRGQTQDAFEKLDNLAHQRVIDTNTSKRLEMLIKEFGRFTE